MGEFTFLNPPELKQFSAEWLIGTIRGIRKGGMEIPLRRCLS